MIKLVFGLALLLFIGWKVSDTFRSNELDAIALRKNWGTYFAAVVVLMPVNWLLESLKWHLLIRHIQPQRFIKTVADVLAGVSTSLLTPNRIGNFVGRSLGLPRVVRVKAIVATIHSNIAQFNASVMFGMLGLTFVNFDNTLTDESGIMVSALFIITIGLLIYLYPKVIDFYPLSRLYSVQMRSGIRHIQEEKVVLKISILFLSMLRYMVFLGQFYLMLRVFHEQQSPEVIVPAIAIVYLITTVIPSFLFGKFLVREASAIFVLEYFGVPTPAILATVMLLWMINLALPALIGAGILMKK